MEDFVCKDLEAAIAMSNGWMQGMRGLLRSEIAEDQRSVLVYRGSQLVAKFNVLDA